MRHHSDQNVLDSRGTVLSGLLSPVLTSDASISISINISISISIRSLCASEDGRDISASIGIGRTQGFDILMLMLALMSRPSSLAHKLLMLMLMFMLMVMLASLVRTGLY